MFYNDLESLMRGVPTYADHVKEIIAIDGRHTTDRKWNLLSDDGSREYLQKFDNVKLIDCSDYEVTKRKLAKELCSTEHLLIIDSDEYIKDGDWIGFYQHYESLIQRDKHKLDLYALPLQRLDSPFYFDYHPVLFHNPSQFTYYQNKHNIPIKKVYSDIQGIFAPDYFLPVVEGIRLYHDHRLRSVERMAIRQDNLDWQFKTQS